MSDSKVAASREQSLPDGEQCSASRCFFPDQLFGRRRDYKPQSGRRKARFQQIAGGAMLPAGRQSLPSLEKYPFRALACRV